MKIAKHTLLLSAPLLLSSAAAQAQQVPPTVAPRTTVAAPLAASPDTETRRTTAVVLGEVTRPGSYKTVDVAALTDLMLRAGKIEAGSYKTVDVAALTDLMLRAGGRTQRADLSNASARAGDNYLGVAIQNVTAETMTRYGAREVGGVALDDIVAGGPAEKAGLRKNDVVLKFEGETVSSSNKLLRLIAEAAPESRVRLLVRRDGTEREISVTLGRRSSAPQSLFETRPQAEDQSIPAWATPYFRVIPAPRAAPAPRAFGGPPGVPGQPPFGGQPGFAVPRVAPVPRADSPALWGFATRATRTIGVTPAELTDQLREFFGVAKERGVLVSSIVKDSPADKAGLKAGDVITQVDETPVSASGDLTRAINRKPEGEVALTVVRDKTARTTRLTPQSARQSF